MAMERFISLVEILWQGKADNIVVSHHSYLLILLLVLFQHFHDPLGSSSQVCRSLIYKSFLHVIKYSTQDIWVILPFMKRVDLSVFVLIFLTFVGEEPKVSHLLNLREVIVRESFFFALNVDATVTGAPQTFRKYRFYDDWAFLSSEYFRACREGSIERRY